MSGFGTRREDTIEIGMWAITDTKLRWLLRRVADGENPEMVYLEEIANARHGSLRVFLDEVEQP